MVALLLLSSWCLKFVTVGVMRLFLVNWIGLQCVVEVFPDHTLTYNLDFDKARLPTEVSYRISAVFGFFKKALRLKKGN